MTHGTDANATSADAVTLALRTVQGTTAYGSVSGQLGFATQHQIATFLGNIVYLVVSYQRYTMEMKRPWILNTTETPPQVTAFPGACCILGPISPT